MNTPVTRRKTAAFWSILLLLLLICTIVLTEITVPMLFGKWWTSVNLIGNPDHRMTTEQYEDLNSDAIRCALEPGEFREEDFNIIVLGDSFVYGMWLGRQDTMPFRLEEIAHAAGYSRIHVINFGWISASPFLSLRLLNDIGKKYKPDLVIELVDMTDFWDDTFYRRAAERQGFFSIAHWIPATSMFLGKWGHDWIKSDWYSMTLWGVPWQRYFAMERPLDQTRPYLDAVIRNLDETHRYAAEQLGVPFVAFVFPRSVQYSTKETLNDPSDEYTRLGPYSLEPFRFVDDVAPHRAYPLVSLLEDYRHTTAFPLTMEQDPHHTSLGNRETARFVWQHLQTLGVLPPVPANQP